MNRLRFLFLVLTLFLPLTIRAQVPDQMVTLSSNGKFLVNSITGKPVFLTGDAPQLLSLELCSMSDVNQYLADRQSRGFNAIWVILADQFDQNGAPERLQWECSVHGRMVGGSQPDLLGTSRRRHSGSGCCGMTVFVQPSFVGNS